MILHTLRVSPFRCTYLCCCDERERDDCDDKVMALNGSDWGLNKRVACPVGPGANTVKINGGVTTSVFSLTGSSTFRYTDLCQYGVGHVEPTRLQKQKRR